MDNRAIDRTRDLGCERRLTRPSRHSPQHQVLALEDEDACAQQQNSPSCRPAGFVPLGNDGLIGNHNDTLVRDAA